MSETSARCHIIGVASQWVMFAVRDSEARRDEMAVELVPFDMIRGVSIRTHHDEGKTVGFTQPRPPDLIGAESLVRAAMSSCHRAVD